MKTIQFREAICEAMTEEMRRDESIYLMGEEVAADFVCLNFAKTRDKGFVLWIDLRDRYGIKLQIHHKFFLSALF